MNKVITRLAMLMALVMLISIGLTACSGNQNNDNDKNNPDNNKQTEEVTVDPNQDVALYMTYWGTPEEKTAVQQALADYKKKQPNVTIDAYQMAEAGYDAQLAVRLSGDEAVNFGYIHTEQGEFFAQEDKLLNWYEKLGEDPDLKKEDFLDGVFYLLDKDNAWGVSASASCFALYYNKDAFAQAGLSVPSADYNEAWTWEQFVEAAVKLTTDSAGRHPGETEFASDAMSSYGVAFEPWWGPVQVLALNSGVDAVMPDGKTFGYATPAGYNAVQALADLIHVNNVAPVWGTPGLPTLSEGLGNGYYGMIIADTRVNLALGKDKTQFGMAALPKLPGGQSGTTLFSAMSGENGSGGALAVFNSGDDVKDDAAWSFAKYMCDEGMKGLYSEGQWMPVLKKYYTESALLSDWIGPNDAHPDTFKAAAVDMILNHAKPAWTLTTKNQPGLDSLIASALLPVWAGTETAQTAMTGVASDVKNMMQGRVDQPRPNK